MWGGFLFPIRKQELGGNAFYALSLQLVTSGDAEKGLLNAEKATELYQELVGLAPRHFPTLAHSLQTQASILWGLGRQDEAIAACREAVGIMRKLVDSETYFLPSLAEALTQLTGYLEENSDADGAAATRTESAEFERRFALLPPQPEFLFEELLPIDLDDEDSDREEVWETASESEGDDKYQDASEYESEAEDKYYDASESQTRIMEAVSEAACLSMTESSSFTSQLDQAAMLSVVAMSPTKERVLTSMKSPFMDVFSTPIEVRLSMQSTPMDILWWMLLGIFFAILYSRII
ncbi:hypothetical protein K438DRAFT_926122 [Mycena galopus ATCC 62051]|nr:hypothetical protein K438DRAFT_926122 [Mycena galopus ATCC 62051]